MDSDTQEQTSSQKLNQAKYSKILSDGTVDTNRLQDEDYDFVKRFVQHAFPETTQVQKELEQTLKRTFILGRGNQKLEKSFSTPKPKSSDKFSKTKLRRLGIIKDKKVPQRLKYQDFVDVHSLWNSYVADLCRFDKDTTEIQRKLNSMDLHGAFLKVVGSNCSSYEALEGIVIKETKNTFAIVTTRNITKTIPKAETTFDIKLENPSGMLRIAGNFFQTRPAERVSKKIKSFVDFVGIKTYKSKLKFSQLIE